VRTRWLISLVVAVLLAFAASVASLLAGSLTETLTTASQESPR
jgi:hypothetical protein